VRDLLAAHGLRVAATVPVRDAAEAREAAERIGFPVALKLLSRTLVHKTEVGGVHLDLATPDRVEAAFDAIRRELEARGLAQEMEGAIVQEMSRGGVETFVGMTQAPGFGALLAFGIGGVQVELWRDVAFRVHPIADVDARDMLDQIRGR